MEWQIERQSFRNINPSLNRNSQLKKKMLYVKRIKNLENLNIQTLISELLAENMEQFYTEIISTVLSVKPCNTNEIKNIIRVLSVYVKDCKFVSLLFSSINKHVADCYKSVDKYWYLVVYIELKTILDPKFDGLFYIREFYSKSNLEVKILFLEYLVEFYDTREAKEVYKREIKKFREYVAQEKTHEAFVLERMETACKKLDILYREEKKQEKEFKPIIIPTENEFDWYLSRNEKIEQYEDGFGIKEMVSFIKTNFNNATKIDSLCKALKQSENLKLIPTVLNKFKNNICYYPVLARIIKNLGTPGRKFTNRLVEDFYGLRRGLVSSHNRCDIINSLVLLSELVKFRSLPPNDIFGLLDHFLRIKDVELYCLLLKNIGRFYLLDEVTNCRTREYLDKGINLGNRCNGIECLYINDMVCRIFPNPKETKLQRFQEFIVFYTQKENFNEESETWEILKRNRKFLFTLFLKPWEFKDLNQMAFLIDKANLLDPIIDFILVLFKTLGKYSKMKTIAFANLLGKVLKFKKSSLQEETIKNIFEMEIDSNIKVRILVSVLGEANYYLKQKFLCNLRKIAHSLKSIEINTLIFNLCEEMGDKIDDFSEDDSFEEEFKCLNGA